MSHDQTSTTGSDKPVIMSTIQYLHNRSIV